jgi:hypothetical protein
MPRLRRRPKLRTDPVLPEAARILFETGERTTPDAAGADALWIEHHRLPALWAEHQAALLEAWIDAHPGTRPWGWWRWEAPEPRRVLRNADCVHLQPDEARPPGRPWSTDPAWRTGTARWSGEGGFGIPAHAPLGHYTLTVEAEAAYLDRLGLLTLDEHAALTAADFAPERLEVDSPTLAELEAARVIREASNEPPPARGGLHHA